MSKPIIFEELTLRNFLSYGNVVSTFLFDNAGTTLIIGENLDNTTQGSTSNGVGKTGFLNALSFAVYDKPVSNITKDNLINNINKKNMIVTIKFRKGNDRFLIERARKAKDGNYVKLFENDKDVTRDSIANTNAYIEQIIGIPFEMFVNIVVFSANRIPFLDLSSADQTSIMEHLNGLTELSTKAESLKEQSKETQSKLKQEEFKIETTKGEHTRHAQQLVTAKDRVTKWYENNIKQRASIEDTLSKYKDFDFEKEFDNIKNIDDNTKALTLLKNDKTNKQRDLQKFDQDKKKYETEITQLQNHECPYCHQHFNDVAAKINELNEKITSILLKSIELVTAITELDEDIKTINTSLAALYANAHFDNIKELSNIQSEVNGSKQKLKDLDEATNPFEEPLKELEDLKLPQINYDAINDITKLIEHQKFLLKILTKKDSFVRKVLLEKNLPYLNKQLREYLYELGLPHKVEFTSELTAEISKHGILLDFGNLSNGQRARVNIALSLAFRDLLQKLHDPINICVLDEVLDVGLDGLGIQAAAKLIKRKAKQENMIVYVISHRDEVENIFDQILTIQMSNGFSQIKQQ